MAKLVEILEPTERQFVIKLTETEANALLFITDMVTNTESELRYKNHYSNSNYYTGFRSNLREAMDSIAESLEKVSGYGHTQDYLE